MAARVHQPDQNILDYRKQQQIRNASALGMIATAMTGIASAYLGASLGVHYVIGVTDRQYGATDVRRNGAISKCLKWGLERC